MLRWSLRIDCWPASLGKVLCKYSGLDLVLISVFTSVHISLPTFYDMLCYFYFLRQKICKNSLVILLTYYVPLFLGNIFYWGLICDTKILILCYKCVYKLEKLFAIVLILVFLFITVNYPAKPFKSEFWIHIYCKLQTVLFPYKLEGQVHNFLPIGSIFPCYPLAILLLSGTVVQFFSVFELHLYIKCAPLWAKLEFSLLHQLVIKDSP